MSKHYADERVDSICVECVHFGDCKHASEGKTICNRFKAAFDDEI